MNHKKIEKLYWLLNYGLPKQTYPDYAFINEGFKSLKPPVFFLSTGRTGTLWFAYLLSRIKGVKAFHEPFPQLFFQSKYIYQLYKDMKNQALVNNMARQLFLTARLDYLLYAAETGKKYIETNNHLTFFAYAITELFPQAKFIHIIRHPGDFVRSGLLRHWYKVPSYRIECNCQDWDTWDRIEKISWLWKETNVFIENFKKTIPASRHITIDFSSINVAQVKKLLNFIELKMPESKINRLLHRKKNTQKNTLNLPPYKEWAQEDKDKVIRQTWDLAQKYGYKL